MIDIHVEPSEINNLMFSSDYNNMYIRTTHTCDKTESMKFQLSKFNYETAWG